MFARKPSSLLLSSSSMIDNAVTVERIELHAGAEQLVLRDVHGDECREVLNFGQNAGAQPMHVACDGVSRQVRDLRL